MMVVNFDSPLFAIISGVRAAADILIVKTNSKYQRLLSKGLERDAIWISRCTGELNQKPQIGGIPLFLSLSASRTFHPHTLQNSSIMPCLCSL